MSPVAHIKLIRKAARLRVETDEPSVLGRPILAVLVEDERAVYHHLEVGSAVMDRRLESRDQAGVLRLVGGGGSPSLAHGRAPHKCCRAIRACDANHAGTGPSRTLGQLVCHYF
jgi:hypothetical protein